MLTLSSNRSTPTRVIILGAGGFLGKRLAGALADTGSSVVALTQRDIDLAAPNAEQLLCARLQHSDTLVFLAAVTPDKGRDSGNLMRNLAMGRAVCTAAAKTKLAQIVYASSDAVYPFTVGLIADDAPAAPIDQYGAMHRTREILLATEAPAPLAVLRFTALYGAGDTHNSYGPNRFIRQALVDRRIPLFGDGEEMRDHLYIDDAVTILRKVIEHESTGMLNVATGTSHSFRAVAERVAAACDAAVAPSPRNNPITHRHFDVTPLLKAIPGIRFTPLEQGLGRAVAAAREVARA